MKWSETRDTGAKKDQQKNTEERIKTLKESKSCLLFSQLKAEEQLAGFGRKAAVEFVKAVSVSTSD